MLLGALLGAGVPLRRDARRGRRGRPRARRRRAPRPCSAAAWPRPGRWSTSPTAPPTGPGPTSSALLAAALRSTTPCASWRTTTFATARRGRGRGARHRRGRRALPRGRRPRRDRRRRRRVRGLRAPRADGGRRLPGRRRVGPGLGGARLPARCRSRQSPPCCAGSRRTPGRGPARPARPPGRRCCTTLATGFGPQPPMTVETVGVGAGRPRPGRPTPNVVRLLLGEPAERRADLPSAVVLETNVDDLDPRLWPDVIAALLAAGASDAWLTPILMKKGRPAHTLSVLVGPRPPRRRAPGRLRADLDDRRPRDGATPRPPSTARSAPSPSTATPSG